MCKVLIIDDDLEDVEILSDAFMKSGVNSIHSVHSAMQAITYLDELNAGELPDLVVTDFYLPGVSGLQFIKDLKQNERYANVHVVLFSSIKTHAEVERYKLSGTVDYFIKPSSYREYLEVAKTITTGMCL